MHHDANYIAENVKMYAHDNHFFHLFFYSWQGKILTFGLSKLVVL